MFNIKSLFSAGKPGDGVPDNRKAAQQWLDDLSGQDTNTQHQQIIEKLATLHAPQTSQKSELQRLEAIDAIDHYAQALQTTLCLQYLNSPRMSQMVEHRLWNAIYAWYINISSVYLDHLKAMTAHPELRAPDPLLARLCTRALYNLGNAFKWRFLRYDSPDGALWQLLHELYLTAEQNGFENQPTPAYDDHLWRCGGLMLRAEILALSHPGALTVDQIDVLDNWLLEHTQALILEKLPNTNRHHYYNDLAEAHAALPITPQTWTTTTRAWDMSSLLIQLQRTRNELSLPKTAAPSPVLTQRQKLLAALTYAEKQWHPHEIGKLRRDIRVKSRQQLSVVHGLSDLYTIIKKQSSPAQTLGINHKSSYQELLDLKMYGFVTNNTRNRQQEIVHAMEMPTLTSNWETENTSNDGYLVHYPAEAGQWLRLGSLIGVRNTESTAGWSACIVRRLIKNQQSGAMAGLEILSRNLTPALLNALQTNPGQASPEQMSFGTAPKNNTCHAILTSPVLRGHFTLLLDIANHAQGKNYQFSQEPGGPPIQLTLGKILHKGDLWVQVEAEILDTKTTG